MPNFKEFLDFLMNVVILNTKHLNLLQAKNPIPIEESDILWTLTDFFKTLESNDFFQITSSLYQKFFAGYDNISGYTKDLAFIKSILGDHKAKKPTKNTKKTKELENKVNGKIEKLYSDSFHKDEFLKIKQEIHMKELLKDCTFVPEINQSKIFAKNLNVPVFERLSKQNTKSSKDVSETQKNLDDIQECTFRPQVLKYIASNYPNNSEKETKAFQRLYQNAESIRQNQKL